MWRTLFEYLVVVLDSAEVITRIRETIRREHRKRGRRNGPESRRRRRQ